jgi:predicted DCC family thiol-disulfide oxidoreductase YuxK
MLEPVGLPPMVGPADRVVLFDGVCKLCSAWARFLIRFDKHHVFKLATLQSDEGKAILTWLGLPTHYYQTMVLIEGPRAFTRSSAFIRVMMRLPFPWPLAAVTGLIPALVRNWLYDRVASNRYTIFGRHEACLLPTADHESRFLRAEGTPSWGNEAVRMATHPHRL